jgi:two-component system response regulator MprA/two-component system response regulator PrrA
MADKAEPAGFRNAPYHGPIGRRLLVTGDARGWLDDAAGALAARANRAWSVQVVHPLASVPNAVRQEWPDVALLHASATQPADLQDAFRWLKVAARLPVLVVTAPADVEQRLLSVAHRIDDHAVEPVTTEELYLRLERLFRARAARRRGPLGDLTLDPATHEVARRGRRVRLTPTEFALVSRLATSPNEPVSVEALAQAASLDIAKRNTVQVHISTLRRKLEDTGPALIHTASGRGYYLRPTPEIDIEQRLALLSRREQTVKEREEAVARRTELLARFETQRRPPR